LVELDLFIFFEIMRVVEAVSFFSQVRTLLFLVFPFVLLQEFLRLLAETLLFDAED